MPLYPMFKRDDTGCLSLYPTAEGDECQQTKCHPPNSQKTVDRGAKERLKA